MPRPRKKCRIDSAPPVVFYKPQGVPLGQLKGVTLAVEGFEAFRLVDAEGLSQEEAAERMRVSRPTICRILGEARSIVAKALANGWAIRIEDRPEPEHDRVGSGNGAESVRAGCRGRSRGCGRRHGGGALKTSEGS